jgi:hypothetical protein
MVTVVVKRTVVVENTEVRADRFDFPTTGVACCERTERAH